MIIETLLMLGRNLLWQSTLLAAIVFCVLRVLPRGQISARYRAALSGLFGAGFLLVLPFLPEVLQPANDVMSMANPLETTPQPFAALANSAAIISEPISRSQFPMSLFLVLTWFAGSGLALSRLVFAALQGRVLSRGFTPVHLKNASNLSRPVTIVRSLNISAPLVFGLFKPTIVVPENFALNLDEPETRIILEHEIAHIVRGDLWVNLAQRIILAALWWCLPLYWINRQISAERENLCDAQATAHIKQSLPSADNPARTLAAALVRFAEQKSQVQTPVLTIGIYPKATPLARRVQLLCDNNPVPCLSKKLMLPTSLAVPATLLMLSLMTPRALANNPQESTPLTDIQEISSPEPTNETKPLPVQATGHTPKVMPGIAPKIVQGRLSSKFGIVRKKFGGKMHTGIDIANKLGTPIYAPADGFVVEATDAYKNSAKWGKVVVIETVGGVQTVFAHLKSYSVSTGQTIKAGEQFAQIGNTGKSTGPHVHLETLIDGQHVDPLTIWPKLPH